MFPLGGGMYNHDLKFCAILHFHSVMHKLPFLYTSITQEVCRKSKTTTIMKWLRDKVKVISDNIFQ